MSKAKWIIEDFEPGNSFNRLADEVKRQGMDCEVITYDPLQKGSFNAFAENGSMWYTKPPHMLLVPEKPLPEISSTEIRRQLNFAKVLKKPCAYMRREVFEYIKENKLFNFNPKADTMGVVRKGR